MMRSSKICISRIDCTHFYEFHTKLFSLLLSVNKRDFPYEELTPRAKTMIKIRIVVEAAQGIGLVCKPPAL